MATATTTPRPLRTAPNPEVEARPDLRVVESAEEAPARHSFASLVGTIAVVLLFVCIFGLVVFQVLLVQTQSHLDDLDGALAVQQSRAEALDLQTADLESPERIVDAALGLGMIAPEDIEYLESVDGDDAGAAYDPATEPVGTTPTTVAESAPANGVAATTEAAGTTATTTGTTGTTVAPGAGSPPGPPYTAENNWGAGGPPTTPPVYTAENNWGAGPTSAPTGGR